MGTFINLPFALALISLFLTIVFLICVKGLTTIAKADVTKKVPIGKLIAFSLPLVLILLSLEGIFQGICVQGWSDTAEYINITVVNKKPIKDDEHSYLITTVKEESKITEVFKISNSWFYYMFDASNRYNSLNEGSSYKIKVAGFPNDEYRDIIKIWRKQQ